MNFGTLITIGFMLILAGIVYSIISTIGEVLDRGGKDDGCDKAESTVSAFSQMYLDTARYILAMYDQNYQSLDMDMRPRYFFHIIEGSYDLPRVWVKIGHISGSTILIETIRGATHEERHSAFKLFTAFRTLHKNVHVIFGRSAPRNDHRATHV